MSWSTRPCPKSCDRARASHAACARLRPRPFNSPQRRCRLRSMHSKPFLQIFTVSLRRLMHTQPSVSRLLRQVTPAAMSACCTSGCSCRRLRTSSVPLGRVSLPGRQSAPFSAHIHAEFRWLGCRLSAIEQTAETGRLLYTALRAQRHRPGLCIGGVGARPRLAAANLSYAQPWPENLHTQRQMKCELWFHVPPSACQVANFRLVTMVILATRLLVEVSIQM